MEHSYFLTNAISTEMVIFGPNDRKRKPRDRRFFDGSSVNWSKGTRVFLKILRWCRDREGQLRSCNPNDSVIMIMGAEQDRHHDRERVFKVRYVDKTVNLLSEFLKYSKTLIIIIFLIN